MHLRLKLATVLLFASASIATLRAQTTIHIPADQPTIQAGINAAQSGDTILVAPGTYTESLFIQTKSIILKSTDGAAATIIDGGGQNIVLRIINTLDANTVIDGFTFTNSQNPGSTSSGGVDIESAAVTFQNNTLIHNYGSGLYVSGIARILNNHIVTTVPSDAPYYCGTYSKSGISILANTPALGAYTTFQSRVAGNIVEGDGSACGGGGIDVSSINPVIVENNIVRNVVYGAGLADLNRTDTDLHIIFRQNLVYNSLISGLNVDYFFYYAPGAPPYGVGPVTIAVTNNTFFNNSAGSTNNGTDITLGDFYAHAGFYNNLIIGNSTTNNVINCQPFGSTDVNRVPAVFDDNDIYNLKAQPGTSVFLSNPDCSYATSQLSINGNSSFDPLFVSSSDFHLQPTSPAIDRGTNSAVGISTTDFSGNPRVQQTYSSTPTTDLGAYELTGNIGPPVATLALTANSYDISAPGPLLVYATLTTPSGPIANQQVVYSVNGLSGATATTDANGVATLTIPNLTPYTVYRLSAVAAGGANYSPSVSPTIYVYVEPSRYSLQLSSATNPSTYGQAVQFTATINTGATVPQGTVQFSLGSNILATTAVDPATHQATASFSTLPVGPDQITAIYTSTNGLGNLSASVIQTVNGFPTTTAITSSVNPASFGQSVTFTAQVTSAAGIPIGLIDFTDGVNNLASVPLTPAGIAIYNTSALAFGSHTIFAEYVPTGGGFISSSASVAEVITSPTTASLTSSLNPSGEGQLVTFTATISPDPAVTSTPVTGTVAFFDGSTLLFTQTLGQVGCVNCIPGSRIASYSTSALIIGNHAISAVFTPTGAFLPSNNNLTQVVKPIAPTTLTINSSLNPSFRMQPVIFTVGISSVDAANGVPTGSITFMDGATLLTTRPLDSSGLASFTTTALQRGLNTITAAYVPTGFFAVSNASLVQTVNLYDTTTTLTPLPGTINAGSSLVISATVAPKSATAATFPSGTVTFLLDSASIGTSTLTSGTATLTTPTLTSGPHTLTCYYEGDTTFSPSTCAPLSFTATTLPTMLTLSTPVSPIYALNAIPFIADLTSNGTPVANAPITITLALPVPSTIGCSGNTNTSGTLACSTNTPNFFPGMHAFSAIYNGDNTHASARTPLTVSVLPNPTTPSLTTSASTAPQGSDLAITLRATTATTAFTPDGTLTLLDGTTPIGSVTLPATAAGNGTIAATLHLTTLSVGVHTLSVAYLPSTSAFIASVVTGAATVTITPSSFTLSSDPAALSIQTQHHASVALNLTSTGAFANTVYLSCNTPLPPVLKCEFARTQVALTAGGTASTTLKLETDAVDNFYAANTAVSPAAKQSGELPALCGCFFATLLALPFASRRRRKAITLFLAAFAVVGLISITGCSGQYPIHTPPGTYDIIVTGIGNGITKTTHITLTVTP